jgi:CRP-like cAMP-binding protein
LSLAIKKPRVNGIRRWNLVKNIMMATAGNPRMTVAQQEQAQEIFGETHRNMGPGGHFGYRALESNDPRQFTVLALENCSFMAIEKKDYNACIQSILKEKRSEKVRFLQNVFGSLNIWTNEIFLNSVYCYEIKEYEKGQHLFIEGQPCARPKLFIIQEGEIILKKNFDFEGLIKIFKKIEVDIKTEPWKTLWGKANFLNEKYHDSKMNLKPPEALSLMTLSKGSVIGEEMMLSGSGAYKPALTS